MSDYCKATTSLWHEGIEVAMGHQSALGEAFSDAMKSWHSTWTGGFEKAVAMNPAAMPPWFKNLTTLKALPQPATVQGDASSTQSSARFAPRRPSCNQSIAIKERRVKHAAWLRGLRRIRPAMPGDPRVAGHVQIG